MELGDTNLRHTATVSPEGPLQTVLVGETDAAGWDVYVRQAAGASNYHLWSWKRVIEDAFHHRTHYLAARRGDLVRGVLPLVEMKSLLFGHFLVSLPFFNYGGVLAETDEVRSALLGRAEQLCRELGVQHLELRQGTVLNVPWPHSAAKVAMIVPLAQAPEAYFKSLSSRLRNKVRHAQKHGLVCRWGREELLPAFYHAFCVNMRNLGTPVYPRRWFESVCGHNPDSTRLLVVYDSDEPVAATLIISFGKFVELPWIASTPAARKHYSSALLYWTAIEWAMRSGYSELDLGRCTPGGGVYEFKQQWNCEERPLHWYYWLSPGTSLPELRPSNPRYRLAISAWQRLPLPLANWLGPHIVRSIP